jgi:hypothetical protein
MWQLSREEGQAKKEEHPLRQYSIRVEQAQGEVVKVKCSACLMLFETSAICK